MRKRKNKTDIQGTPEDEYLLDILLKYFGDRKQVLRMIAEFGSSGPDQGLIEFNFTPKMAALGVRRSVSKWAESLPNFSSKEATRFKKYVTSMPTFTPIFQQMCEAEISLHIFSETRADKDFEEAWTRMQTVTSMFGKFGEQYYKQFISSYSFLIKASDSESKKKVAPGQINDILQTVVGSNAKRQGREWFNRPALDASVISLFESISKQIKFVPDSRKNLYSKKEIAVDIADFTTKYLRLRHGFREITITSRYVSDILTTK
ncbi:MAG: hypothetical protein AB7T49_00315 [Oligoflexales bacterium]